MKWVVLALLLALCVAGFRFYLAVLGGRDPRWFEGASAFAILALIFVHGGVEVALGTSDFVAELPVSMSFGLGKLSLTVALFALGGACAVVSVLFVRNRKHSR